MAFWSYCGTRAEYFSRGFVVRFKVFIDGDMVGMFDDFETVKSFVRSIDSESVTIRDTAQGESPSPVVLEFV